MTELLWVGVGGFFGAIARYQLGGWAHRAYGGAFPVGTLVVNVLGCFALGLLMAWVDRGAFSPEVRLVVGVGFLGALTTYSTFGYETLELLRRGSTGLAAANAALNLAVGLLAVWLGTVLVRLLAAAPAQ